MSSAADTRTSIGNSTGVGNVSVSVRDPPHGLGHVLDRDAVLHLDEVHPPRAAEHPVAAIDELPLGRRRGDEPGDPRRQRREPATDPAHHAEGEVLPDPLVADVAPPGLGRPWLVRPRVPLDLAAAGARHPVQLEVVDRGGVLGEPVEHVVEDLHRLAGRGGRTPGRTAA